jgi:hypothetical protein
MGREERDVNTEFIAMAHALETACRRLKIRIGLSRLGPLIDPYRPPLAFALHALLTRSLTFTRGIERSVSGLDLTLSLVMPHDQAI